MERSGEQTFAILPARAKVFPNFPEDNHLPALL